MCQSTNQGCAIPIGKQPSLPYIDGNCAQGNVPDYYIDVRHVSDATKGLAFATKYQIPIVVKNSGHDYKGRSAAPYSLALWTYNYQSEITLTNDFIPEGCTNSMGNVVTFGAGQAWEDIYCFSEQHNITIPGGSSETVGAAGGWITGGGHSAISPVFGLGVDNVQQFRVVLPNGNYVTANRCQNQDIFFACRGGWWRYFWRHYGDVYAGLPEIFSPGISLLILHRSPSLTSLCQFVSFPFPSLGPTEQYRLVEILVSHANEWASQGWGGYGYPAGQRSSNGMQFINPLLNATEARESLKPLVDFASSLGYSANFVTYPSWCPLYREHVFGGLGSHSSIGATMSSRLIPSWHFEGKESQTRLTEVLSQSTNHSSHINISLMVLMVTPWRTPDSDSSVTPAWRHATWHVISTTVWDPTNVTAGDVEQRFKAVRESLKQLRDLTPEGGAYLNEADTFEQDPPTAFWGADNYAKLLDIKKELDPQNLMQVHQGVGWNADSEIFSCYPKVSH